MALRRNLVAIRCNHWQGLTNKGKRREEQEERQNKRGKRKEEKKTGKRREDKEERTKREEKEETRKNTSGDYWQSVIIRDTYRQLVATRDKLKNERRIIPAKNPNRGGGIYSGLGGFLAHLGVILVVLGASWGTPRGKFFVLYT